MPVYSFVYILRYNLLNSTQIRFIRFIHVSVVHSFLLLSNSPQFENTILSFLLLMNTWALGFVFFILIYFWLCWVFVAARGLSLVVVSGVYSWLRCTGFSLWWLLLLQSTGSRACRFQQLWHMGSVVVTRGLQSTGSVVVAHRLSGSAACGIFLDQGSNPGLLRWQVDS